VAIGRSHAVVADEDGVVWAFGIRKYLGLDGSGPIHL